MLNIPIQRYWRQMPPMPAAMLPPGLQEARADFTMKKWWISADFGDLLW